MTVHACIRQLSSSTEVKDDIHRELTKYKADAGNFRLNEAIRQRKDKHTSPGKLLLFRKKLVT